MCEKTAFWRTWFLSPGKHPHVNSPCQRLWVWLLARTRFILLPAFWHALSNKAFSVATFLVNSYVTHYIQLAAQRNFWSSVGFLGDGMSMRALKLMVFICTPSQLFIRPHYRAFVRNIRHFLAWSLRFLCSIQLEILSKNVHQCLSIICGQEEVIEPK